MEDSPRRINTTPPTTLHRVEPDYVLHRCFCVTQRMRGLPEEHLNRHGVQQPRRDLLGIEQRTYLSLWFMSLHVVVEGWSELGLHDAEIDRLIASPNTAMPRRHRHGVAHFQRDYFSPKLYDFYAEPDSVIWAAELHDGFSRYLLDWIDKQMSVAEHEELRTVLHELLTARETEQPNGSP